MEPFVMAIALESIDPRYRPAERKLIPLAKVEIDRSTQARVRLNPNTVKEYTELLERGIEFKDEVEVYFDGFVYWVGDGFHRLAAYRKLEKGRIPALVREGTIREAMIHAAGANAEHGLPRKREDVQRAIKLLLEDDVTRRFSSRTLAKLVRCAANTVQKAKDEMGLDAGTVVYTDKHGNESEMDVSGQKQRPRDNPLTSFKDLPNTLRGSFRQTMQEMKSLGNARKYAFARAWMISYGLPVNMKDMDKRLREVDALEAGYETEGQEDDSEA
jgi:hypothetical protein